ncbi:hypothetical protein PtA15_17A64 [Puccinia triticina]|uniref:Uncharacterized protein n=1 Tax=Puccinia triticina TaxID=208348 RepID=A0ABY7D693_9BASI|nr:uncharacterized protein PtA15_17A64 [Puccinia triticina]WAQ92583.1 hypothetical protein PtA15_17A64 [Puccinia triticina]WAR63469.1 hypothetical protein PtB15_17B69 [Puccinia triticina]
MEDEKDEDEGGCEVDEEGERMRIGWDGAAVEFFVAGRRAPLEARRLFADGHRQSLARCTFRGRSLPERPEASSAKRSWWTDVEAHHPGGLALWPSAEDWPLQYPDGLKGASSDANRVKMQH